MKDVRCGDTPAAVGYCGVVRRFGSEQENDEPGDDNFIEWEELRKQDDRVGTSSRATHAKADTEDVEGRHEIKESSAIE